MTKSPEKHFSAQVSVFQNRKLPEQDVCLAGYAALITVYSLSVPLPEKLALISRQHRRYDTDAWAVYTPRHQPEPTLAGHIAFALRYEGVDLAVLHALFTQTEGEDSRRGYDGNQSVDIYSSPRLAHILWQRNPMALSKSRMKQSISTAIPINVHGESCV